jgi:hypothetical protein
VQSLGIPSWLVRAIACDRGEICNRRVFGAHETVPDDEGYALVDALVALLIFAIAMAFSLQAGRQARLAADQAREVREAQVLLAHLIETGPSRFEDAMGATGGFTWRIETRLTGAEQPIAICHRQVAIRNARTQRAYQLATLGSCPVEAST